LYLFKTVQVWINFAFVAHFEPDKKKKALDAYCENHKRVHHEILPAWAWKFSTADQIRRLSVNDHLRDDTFHHNENECFALSVTIPYEAAQDACQYWRYETQGRDDTCIGSQIHFFHLQEETYFNQFRYLNRGHLYIGIPWVKYSNVFWKKTELFLDTYEVLYCTKERSSYKNTPEKIICSTLDRNTGQFIYRMTGGIFN
jgi:hypothetical protein